MKKILFLTFISIFSLSFCNSVQAAEDSTWVSVKKAADLAMQKVYEKGANFVTLKNYQGWKKATYRLLQAGFSFGFVTFLLHMALQRNNQNHFSTLSAIIMDLLRGNKVTTNILLDVRPPQSLPFPELNIDPYFNPDNVKILTSLEKLQLIYNISVKYPWSYAWNVVDSLLKYGNVNFTSSINDTWYKLRVAKILGFRGVYDALIQHLKELNKNQINNFHINYSNMAPLLP